METLGMDMTDDSLKDSPKRVAKMYVNEIFGGLLPENKPGISTFSNKYKSVSYTHLDVYKRQSYNRDRMFMLGLVNHTLTEDIGKEYILGFGYILKDLKLKMNFRGKERTLKSDLNIRGDFSLRDSQTRITNIPVSYTHLDVYKRQVQYRSAILWRWRKSSKRN